MFSDMKEKKSESTNQESLDETKKTKSNSITSAIFIGFMVGIIIYSIAKNSWGMVTLIPLFFVYKLVKNSQKR